VRSLTTGLATPGDRVAVAVSGGADSVALAWLLHDVVATGVIDLTLSGLVHVNHGLRGDESDRDEAFVRALAGRLGVPCAVTRVAVAEEARAAHRSLESAARAARDRWFAEALEVLGASTVATAHTADDQAETVLLRLLRGSAARGVGGIRPRRGWLIRPLLDVRRTALRADLLARGESWCEDSSNADRSIPRNAIRHDLLPVLERLAPGGIAALARFAGLARDDERELERRAIELAQKIVLDKRDTVVLDRAAVAALPPALARRVVREALERVHPHLVGARAIDAIRELAGADTTKGRLSLPGVTAEIRPETPRELVLVPGARRTPTPAFDWPLPVPGSVAVPEAGVRVVAERVDAVTLGPWPNGQGPLAAVQESALRHGLRVRGRRPGDRLRPLGAPGRRKVQDVLVDRKVPRHERDRVPIVVDAEGQIVWVAGHALADECRVTAPESGVVLLKIIDL
jgi:tRNA(Ile)-lysidine synthase